MKKPYAVKHRVLLSLLCIAVFGCSVPKPVLTASDAVIKHTTALKKQSNDFVAQANAVRQRAEKRLASAYGKIAGSQALLANEEKLYLLLSDKTGPSILKQIRSDDPVILKDPYGHLSIVNGYTADEIKFGPIKKDTKDLDIIIKNINAVRSEKPQLEGATFIFKTIEKINASLKTAKDQSENDDTTDKENK